MDIPIRSTIICLELYTARTLPTTRTKLPTLATGFNTGGGSGFSDNSNEVRFGFTLNCCTGCGCRWLQSITAVPSSTWEKNKNSQPSNVTVIAHVAGWIYSCIWSASRILRRLPPYQPALHCDKEPAPARRSHNLDRGRLSLDIEYTIEAQNIRSIWFSSNWITSRIEHGARASEVNVHAHNSLIDGDKEEICLFFDGERVATSLRLVRIKLIQIMWHGIQPNSP